MNTSGSLSTEVAHQKFAHQLAQRLQEGEADLPFEVTERLRAARHQAVQRRKVTFSPLRMQQAAPAVGQLGAADGEGSGFWGRFAGWLPLAALLAGLFLIQSIQNDQRARELAEIDAALLIDDLPPAAYADPGFAHFLKTQAIHSP